MTMTKLIIILLLTVCIFSIEAKQKIINGIQVDNGIFPAVIRLNSRCTGTFIEHNILLTAAHCFRDPSVNVSIQTHYYTTWSSHIFLHPNYSRATTRNSPNDLALVVFQNNASPAIRYVAYEPPQINYQVTLVGFGYKDYPNGNYGIKNYGTNYISEINDIFIVIRRPESETPHATGVYSTAYSGDSGGPLFYNNQIIGVAKSAGRNNTNYTNITIPENLEFINKILNEYR